MHGVVSGVCSRKRNSVSGLFWGSIRFRAAFLSSLWGFLPDPAAFLRIGSCHALQHPSLFLGIKGNLPGPPAPQALRAACQHPHPPRGQKADLKAGPFALPSPSSFGFLPVFHRQKPLVVLYLTFGTEHLQP